MGMSKVGRDSLKRWKLSLNRCYDVYLDRTFVNDEKVKQQRRLIMFNFIQDIDKEATRRLETCSIFPDINHPCGQIFNVMRTGEKQG